MREVVISVDVYCQWVTTPFAYRLYIDEDLLTERTYIWNNTEQYIVEQIVVNLEPGIHSLKVEHVGSQINKFRTNNFKINNKPANLVAGQFTVN